MKKFLSLILCVCIISTTISVLAVDEPNWDELIEERLTTEVKTAISKDLTLLEEWGGTPITWESSDESVIDNEGKVTRKAEDVTVTLTAKENGVAVKTLTFVVLSENTNVWYSENFYRPDEKGEIRPSDGSSSHSLNFVEKDTGVTGKAGFYKSEVTTNAAKTSLAIAENPNNAKDYSLLSEKIASDTTTKPNYYFSLPDGILPTGKVTVKWTLTTTGLATQSSTANAANGHHYIKFYDGKATQIGGSMHWLSAGGTSVKFGSSTTVISTMAKSQDGDAVTSTFSVVFDFDEGTAFVTESPTGTNGTVSSTKISLSTDNKTLKRINFNARYSNALKFYVDDLVITSTRQEIVVPEKTRKVTVSYNNNNYKPTDTTNKDYLYITMPYNEKYNQKHRLRGFQELALTTHTAIDLCGAWLVGITNSEEVQILRGGDERAACEINDSYIGASHGEPAGVHVTSTAHGKTPADVGSRWKDASNNNWNLLRVVDENTLMFISDNRGTLSGYSFLKPEKGSAISLTHAGTASDKSDAVHTEAIEGTVLKIDQIFRAYKTPTVEIYTIEDDDKTEVTDDLLAGSKKASGDAIEFIEIYTVINPATIANALRENRDYEATENPDLAVGEGMLEVKNTYRYDNTGTVLVYMEYKALMDIDMLTLKGIQYRDVMDDDNNKFGYGGGIYKYIPKVTPVENVKAIDGSTIEKFDLTQPWRCDVEQRPITIHYSSEYWEDSNNPPNREVVYYNNSETEKFKTAFSAGYLPIDDGVASKRKELVANDAYYYYNSNKGYPRFVGNYKATQGDVFKGVAFRKISEVSEDEHNYTSIVPINEGEDVYYYIDYHKTGEDTTILPTSYAYEVIEQSENTEYSVEDNVITTSADCSGEMKYGYIVLKATKKENLRVSEGSFDKESGYLTGYIQNDTQQSKTLTALAAVYNNDGKLLETVTIPNIMVEAGKEVFKVFPFKNKNIDKAKIFTFNSLNVLKPETTPHYATVK